MENKQIYPSELMLKADLWKLTTAIFLVTDVMIDDYTSIKDETEANEQNEIYQLAVGSFRAEKLVLLWDDRENDYWVDPDAFIIWCMVKEICPTSSMITVYKKIYATDPNFSIEALSDADSHAYSERRERKLQPKQEDKIKVLTIADIIMKKKPTHTLDSLLEDEDLEPVAANYTPKTVESWITEKYPHLKRPIGRPSIDCKK
jgi:hypothetical protein